MPDRFTRAGFRLCLAAAATALLWGQQVVVLEVERDRVTAADLARLMPEWGQAPGTTEIFYAPLPGLTRDVARAEIERLAARHGIETATPWQGPDRLRIRRRLRRLEAEEAASALAAAAAERYRIPPDDVAVELIGFSAPLVPSGELRFRSTGAFYRSEEAATAPLTWVTPERRSGTLWLRARVSVRGNYAVAARRIEARVPIEAGDVVFHEGPLPSPPTRWNLAAEELLGRSLARPVAAGDRIDRAWVIATPAVERGALLELRLARGRIELRVPGRAEQAGAVGERVPFRNLESGRRVTARIVNAQQAEVIADRSVAARGGKP